MKKRKLIKLVNKRFKTLFNTHPLLIFSPGRINLIGEHTDYNEGFVFPAAINKGISLGIQKSRSNKSSVYAINKEEHYEFDLSGIVPLKDGGWRNYIIGVVAEIQKTGISLGNFNIAFAGNIPGGAGMSSSAALENSVVYGLNELFDLKLTKSQMILISQKAEHNFAHVKCGIMDQYASMFGKKDSALLLDCRNMESKRYKIDFKDYTIVLINTNVKHDLSESAYNDRRAVCEAMSKKLQVSALRDANVSDLAVIEHEVSSRDYQQALYVLEENERVQKFSKAIKKNDLTTLGQLLYESHMGLSNQYKVSCEELDFLVDLTKDNPNILGARMMGGGFGGCTINLIRKDCKKDIKAIVKQYESKFKIQPSVYSIKLSDGVKKSKDA